MGIRNATYHDAPAIKALLEALGYEAGISLLVNQLEMLFGKDDHQVFVYEVKKEVLAFVAVHYLPQLGFEAEMALISDLLVDESVKGMHIAKELEQYVIDQAKVRKCDRVQVYCDKGQVQACAFYLQQGYQQYPLYFTKRLVYAK